jgi:hypothetical integral membrane protein (TIGR02206 family)
MNNLSINWYGIRGVYLAWQPFGVAHLGFLFLAILGCFLVHRHSTPKSLQKLGFLAIFLFLFKFVFYANIGSLTPQVAIPLHLCTISLLLVGISLSFKIAWLQRIAAFWSFLPGLFVLLYPEIQPIENVLSYPVLDFYLTHGLTFAAVFGIVKFNVFSYKDLFLAIGGFLGFLIIAYFTNLTFGSNYMFLSDNPMIFAKFSGQFWTNRWFVIAVFIMGFIVEFYAFRYFAKKPCTKTAPKPLQVDLNNSPKTQSILSKTSK